MCHWPFSHATPSEWKRQVYIAAVCTFQITMRVISQPMLAASLNQPRSLLAVGAPLLLYHLCRPISPLGLFLAFACLPARWALAAALESQALDFIAWLWEPKPWVSLRGLR